MQLYKLKSSEVRMREMTLLSCVSPAAWTEGLDWCNAGWLCDGTVQYPIIIPRPACGLETFSGLRSYGSKDKDNHFDAFCFTSHTSGENDTLAMNTRRIRLYLTLSPQAPSSSFLDPSPSSRPRMPADTREPSWPWWVNFTLRGVSRSTIVVMGGG